MTEKLRLLFNTENPTLLSGFGTYYKEILTRLHTTGKYDIAELCCYAKSTDEYVWTAPWKVFANAPDNEDKEGQKIYNQTDVNQFGLWRLDRTLLEHKSHHLVSIKDPWMLQFEGDSGLRPYFHLNWMPTIDSAPQRPYWLEAYSKADAIFTYSEFGLKTLQKQAGNKINLKGCASPGIDPNLYKPVIDKKQHRQSLGLSPDINIVGTVMRNQKRKLFADLFKAFRQFLDDSPTEIAKKTCLYIHTSFPEKSGWDLPGLILEYGISNRILTTYVCKTCRNWFPSFFSDARAICKHCGNYSAIMPNVVHGLTTKQLVDVYNLFDVYVQLMIAGGFEMPIMEAAACGVPVMATDFTAAADVVRYCRGYPIKVGYVFRELETGADRCYSDLEHLNELLIKFFQLPFQIRRQKGFQARQGCIKRYNWDATAKIWEEHFDSTPLNKRPWDAPPIIFQPNLNIPNNLSDEQFVAWCLTYIANRPEDIYQYKGIMECRGISQGAEYSYGYIAEMNRQKFVEGLKNEIVNKNTLEKARCGMISLPKPSWIKAAYKNE